jgi:hypothetical protein
VARAVRGTIDPTQAEIDAHNAAHPDVRSSARTLGADIEAPGFSLEVPAASIAEGAFTSRSAATRSADVRVTTTTVTDFVIPAFKMTSRTR